MSDVSTSSRDRSDPSRVATQGRRIAASSRDRSRGPSCGDNATTSAAVGCAKSYSEHTSGIWLSVSRDVAQAFPWVEKMDANRDTCKASHPYNRDRVYSG